MHPHLGEVCPQGLVTAAHLVPFLLTINGLLGALHLSQSEIETLGLPSDRSIHTNIGSALEDIQKSLDALKEQFEKLKR